MTLSVLFLILGLAQFARGDVDHIEVKGKQFFNSKTGEPFYIRGVDYQPGGSSDVSEKKDPLSDPEACARDIVLFQELGINTIRIYSVNPELNHDKCMTLLATAGIYLILDVNSPMENQHLNRYQPWTTYNEIYLEHVFKVVEQFSHYDNTLGFFAGNEIVNDEQSAKHSPPYIKAVVKDMKKYIKKNSPRIIPVGYSAADDLFYRVPLSYYLECCEDPDDDISVDFYGVNSYQWCGTQSMESSGYDELVEAYKNFTKPVFLSEFGCNEVLPRQFDEIKALYSKDMCGVFSGGLLYEFTQGPNNYGLVDLDSNGNVRLLDDFTTLKSHYNTTKMPSKGDLEQAITADNTLTKLDESQRNVAICHKSYENLKIDGKVASGLADNLIKKGVTVDHGNYVDLNDDDLTTKFEISNANGDEWKGSKSIRKVNHMTASERSRGTSENPNGGTTGVGSRGSKNHAVKSLSIPFKIMPIVLAHMLYHFLV